MNCPGNAIAAACQAEEDRLYDRDAALEAVTEETARRLRDGTAGPDETEEAIADGLDQRAARLIHRAAYHGEQQELRRWLDERYQQYAEDTAQWRLEQKTKSQREHAAEAQARALAVMAGRN